MNLLELLAVLLSLKSPLVPRSSALRLFSDNVTTVQALRNNRSTASIKVTLSVQEIFETCNLKEIQLEAHRIPGKLNVLADALSRNSALPGEWELHPIDRSRILSLFPKLEIDLMATPFNALLPEFISPFSHPLALAVDTWTRDWNQWQMAYLFPPPSQLPRVMEALSCFRGKMVLVLRAMSILLWPFKREALQPLYPLLQPPRQLVRGRWVEDGKHESNPWTVFIFSQNV